MLTKESIKSKLLLCAAALSLSAMGCATDDVDAEGVDQADGLALQAPASKDLKGGDAYFASIKPNGTGCPPGSADVSISGDGKTFTVTYSSYEATVDKNKTVDIKDCQLGIKLKSPSGLSYSVYDFYYQGYAFLANGQSAKQVAKYYFQGAPQANQREVSSNLQGPFDDTYTIKDTVGIADAVWSPCGAERDLNIRTTLRLQNSSSKKTDGYINIAATDGEVDTKLHFRLNWRSCK